MPLNYTPISWKNVDPTNKDQMKIFLLQLADFLNNAFSSPFLAGAINGHGLLAANSIATSVTTANQTSSPLTINASGIFLVFVDCALTGAINHTTTINNLDNGAFVFWRISNTSGAARTITVTATSPGAVAYTNIVSAASTGAITWNLGVSVNNGASGSLMGAAAFDGTLWRLRGVGNNA